MRYLLIPSILALVSAGHLPHLHAAENGSDRDMPEKSEQVPEKNKKGQREGRRGKKNRSLSPEQLDEIFSILDSDADGSINKEEFAKFADAQKTYAKNKRKEQHAQTLAEYDVNGDGELSDQERSAAQAGMRQAMMKKKLDNLKTQNPEEFAKIDSDGDGSISEQEMTAMRAQQMKKMSDRMKEHNPETFAKIDSNGDGSIDQAEMTAARKSHKRQSKHGATGQKQKRENNENSKPDDNNDF